MLEGVGLGTPRQGNKVQKQSSKRICFGVQGWDPVVPNYFQWLCTRADNAQGQTLVLLLFLEQRPAKFIVLRRQASNRQATAPSYHPLHPSTGFPMFPHCPRGPYLLLSLQYLHPSLPHFYRASCDVPFSSSPSCLELQLQPLQPLRS